MYYVLIIDNGKTILSKNKKKLYERIGEDGALDGTAEDIETYMAYNNGIEGYTILECDEII